MPDGLGNTGTNQGNKESDVTLEYEVKNYKNPGNLNNRLRKCESFSFFNDNCDPLFHFAAFILDENGEPVTSLRREAGPFTDLKSIANVLKISHVHRTFPEMIEVELDVYDDDLVGDEKIALFRRRVPIDRIGSHEVNMGTDVSVDIVITVKCSDEFYGDRCDVFCRSIPGSWTCNNITGSRECSKFCAQGSCQLTTTSSICICSSGWVGDHCDRAVDREVISSIIIPDSVYSDVGIRNDFSTHEDVQSVVQSSTSLESLALDMSQPPTEVFTEQSGITVATSASTAGSLSARESVEQEEPVFRTPMGCNTTGLERDTTGRSSNCSVGDEESPAIRSASSSWSYQTTLVIPLVATLLAVTLLAILGILFCRSRNSWNRKKRRSVLINPTYEPSKAHFPVRHKYENEMVPFASKYHYLPRTLPKRHTQTHTWHSRSLGRHQHDPLPLIPSCIDRPFDVDHLPNPGASVRTSSESETLRKLRFAPQKYSGSTNTTELTPSSRTMSYEPPSTIVSCLQTGRLDDATNVLATGYEELASPARVNEEYDIWENEAPVSVNLSSFS